MSGSAPRREDLPDGSVRIHFAAPIVGIGGTAAHSLVLRLPTAGELWEIGDPRGFIYNDAGLGTPYVDRPLLLQWIRKLITEHDADIIARERDASLGMLIEEAVLDFFKNARMRLKPASALSPPPA